MFDKFFLDKLIKALRYLKVAFSHNCCPGATQPVFFDPTSNSLSTVANNGTITPVSGSVPVATTTTQGTVLKAAASANSAAAAPATYTQAEVQSILDELRDLKAKLQAAGILS